VRSGSMLGHSILTEYAGQFVARWSDVDPDPGNWGLSIMSSNPRRSLGASGFVTTWLVAIALQACSSSGSASGKGGSGGTSATGGEGGSTGGFETSGTGGTGAKAGSSGTGGALGTGGMAGGGGFGGESGGAIGTGGAAADGGAANCAEFLRQGGFSDGGPGPSCKDCPSGFFDPCTAAVQCLALAWPCSGSCATNCYNQAGGNNVVSCVSGLLAAANCQ